MSSPMPHSCNPMPHSSVESDFVVCFKFGNVSVCSGCCSNFSQSDDLVIKHAEFRSYNNPSTGLPTSKFGNAYYHVKMNCLKFRWPTVSYANIVVPDEVAAQLNEAHKSVLYQEFSIQFG